MSSEALATVTPRQVAVSQWIPIEELTAQVAVIQQAMQKVMHDGEHYGTIPGTPKPSLWKPGAEKLCFLFRLAPDYEINALELSDKVVTYQVKCVLRSIATGAVWGSGMGLCSSRESKYGLRDSKRQCPKCGKAAIIKGKQEYGGGWVCFKKQDGCGAKFEDGDANIERQTAGKIPVENVWEQANTILKMACKRAHVAAVLASTAASDIFTQDIEDFAESVPQEPQRQAPRGGTVQPIIDRVLRDIRGASTTAQLLQIAQAFNNAPMSQADLKTAQEAWQKRSAEVAAGELPHDPGTGEVVDDSYAHIGPPPMSDEEVARADEVTGTKTQRITRNLRASQYRLSRR